MDSELLKEYFEKGFRDSLEKRGFDMGTSFKDNFQQGMAFGAANAVLMTGAQVVGGAVSNWLETINQSRLSSRYKRFITKLIKKHPVLKDRDPRITVSHYQTMVRLAPSIALDENIVSGFLKESGMYDAISTPMVKTLLDIENTTVSTSQGKKKPYTELFPTRVYESRHGPKTSD